MVAVGNGVMTIAPGTAGDEVLTHTLPLRDQGAWAEWLIAPFELVALKPDGVRWDVAGAFPVPALT